MRSFNSLVLLSAASITSACIYSRSESQDWGYTGVLGPVMWHTLSSENSVCATGKHQSPINLNSAISLIDGSYFDFPDTADIKIFNNGHTIEAEPIGEDYKFISELGGEDYVLKQFHFHTPSEHTLNGKGYPLEAHFVHSDDDGNLAVFGIFFEISPRQGSSFFHKMPFRDLTSKDGSAVVEAVDLSSILNLVRDAQVRNYSGSLTTPPCSEGVNWFVAESPLSISAAQYQELARAVGFTSRFTQGEPGSENVLSQECKVKLTVQ